MNKQKAQQKATIATAVFTLYFAISASYVVSDWAVSLPLAIFYVGLIINTYFSLVLFSQITPPDDMTQNAADLILGVFYFLLPLALAKPLLFYFLATVFFTGACMKYDRMLGVIHQPKLLKRKIMINLTGAMGCLVTFGAAVAGYTSVSWLFAGGFVFAHFLLLYVRPMYRLD